LRIWFAHRSSSRSCFAQEAHACLINRTLLTAYLRGSRAELSASILQAFLRPLGGTGVRPTGRRCSSGRHVRSFCLFMLPWGRRFGSGNPGSNPGGATHRPRSRRTRVRWDPLNPTRLVRGPSYDTKWQSPGVLGIGVLPARPKINRVS